jgi:predicted HicB family RNase H-like nuclease
MEYKGYTARVVFDEDAGVLFGEVEGLRDVVTFEATNANDLKTAFRESVDDYLSMCAERGEEPEKPYSGKFLLRVDARLHREIAMAAARSGKSLNAFASEVMKNWIQRERQTTSPSRPSGHTANARISEALAEYVTPGADAVMADSEKKASVYTEWTRDTPGSITPGKMSNTESTSRTPGSKTPSSKPPSKKAA